MIVKILDFNPACHGLHFKNDFSTLGLKGLCGGMSLYTFNSFRHRLNIPTHKPMIFGTADNCPPDFSRFKNEIFAYQFSSYASIGEIFSFQLNDTDITNQNNRTFLSIKRAIDANKFALVGLRSDHNLLESLGNGNAFGHQVLCYGYDDSNNSIFVYDSNHPDLEVTLAIDPSNGHLVHSSGDNWMIYFMQTDLDQNNPNIFTELSFPAYHDLTISQGFIFNRLAIRQHEGVSYSIKIKNEGEWPAHFQKLLVFARGPLGENLDGILGKELLITNLNPGEEVEITHNITSFSERPGMYEFGISMLTEENQWVEIYNHAARHLERLRLQVVPAGALMDSGWNTLLAEMKGAPFAVQQQNGLINLFAVTNDGKLNVLVQQTAADDSAFAAAQKWSVPNTLKGKLTGLVNKNNCVEVFPVCASEAMCRVYQKNPNITSLSEWTEIIDMYGPNEVVNTPKAVLNQDGRIEVFARNYRSEIQKCHHMLVLGLTPWSLGWEQLHASVTFDGELSATLDGSGRLNVLGVDGEGKLWRNFQREPNSDYEGWQILENGLHVKPNPLIFTHNDGRMEVFAFDRNTGILGHKWQNAVHQPFTACGLFRAAGSENLNPDFGLNFTKGNDGFIHLVGVTHDSMIMTCSQRPSGDFWGPWVTRGAHAVGQPVLCGSPSGRIHIFAQNLDHQLIHNSY